MENQKPLELDIRKMKRCSICHELKPRTQFSKNRHNKDGLDNRCKKCTSEYRAPHKPVLAKLCRRCKKVKPASEFSPQPRTSDRLDSYCKECKNATSNKRKLELRDTRKREIVKLMGGHCQRCGYSELLAAMVFHHVDPDKKKATPSKFLDPAFSSEEALIEFDKCVLLCANCHLGFTAGEWGYDDLEPVRRGSDLPGYTLEKRSQKASRTNV